MSEPVLLPTNVATDHYELVVTPNLETCEFDGDMSLEVTCGTAGTNTVELHSKEINIVSATYEPEGGEAIACTGISYDLELVKVVLKFKSDLPLGKATVKVVYKGILNSDMAGFYISHYTDAEGEKRRMASTQFEALDARRAFPCVDEPAAKATFGLTLVVDKALCALSNMPETSVKHLKGGKKSITFDRTPKMSTYLLAWAVGEFDCLRGTTKNGVSISIYSPPGRAHHGKFALQVGIDCLDMYDDFFGVPYPLPKLDMICITEFAMGAMENWGLVTYREVDLMIDEQKASTAQLQRVGTVVAHELAHQWFGNLVTMNWWDDLWLNEGFAAYMEHYALEKCLPLFDIWDQYVVGAMAAAMSLDSLRTSHPIQVPIAHAEEVEQVFDAISYCKGSSAVRMVSCMLGPDKFREGLQKYMKKYAYGNTKTIDLWTAWSEVSGMDVANIMNTWTSQMGYPVITVQKCDIGAGKMTITLAQEWFLADGSELSAEDKAKTWTIPLLFATLGETSSQAVLMTEKVQTFEVPVSKESYFLKINSGQQALARVNYTPAMITGLTKAIKEGKLSTIDRAGVLLDAYYLAKAGVVGASFETVVTILKALEGERSYAVWKAMAIVLNAIDTCLKEVGGEAYAEYVRFAGKLVKDAVAVIGWSPKEGESHMDKLLRGVVVAMLDIFCADEPEVVAEARSRFETHFEDPSVIPSDIKANVYKVVLKAGGLAEYERILKTYTDTTDNSERKYAMLSLGAARDPTLKARTLDWTVKSGEVKTQDIMYAIGVTGGSQAGAEQAWAYFKDNVDFIKDKLKRASPSLLAAVVVNSVNFCSHERAAEVEAYFEANPIQSCSRRIAQLVESIRNMGTMLNIVKDSDLVQTSFWTSARGL